MLAVRPPGDLPAARPLERWRTTNASTPIAAIVSIVSRRLSPLLTLSTSTAKFIVSADSRLAAVSKLEPGAGRVLEEQADDGLAAQRRHLGDRALALTSTMWSVSSSSRWMSVGARARRSSSRCFIDDAITRRRR